MNNLSQDAWFFAHEGAKGGPVEFSALQAMAREGKLHPRQDLVWSKGMDSWQPSGEVQGLFERRRVAEIPVEIIEPPALDSPAIAEVRPADPAVAPQAEELETWQESLGSPATEPSWSGARRRSYLFVILVFPILWTAVIAAASTFVKSEMDQQTLMLIASGLMAFPAVLIFYFSLMRLVNLGMSRWWFLAHCVPLLNLWINYRCFACPAGYAVHKKLDGAGVFLAIIYWLLFAVVVVTAGMMVAIVLGELGTPEVREQLIDGIKAILPAGL